MNFISNILNLIKKENLADILAKRKILSVRDIRKLKNGILKDPLILNSCVDFENTFIDNIIYDIAILFINTMKMDDFTSLNIILKYLLNQIYLNADNARKIDEALKSFDVFAYFKNWLKEHDIMQFNENLAYRCFDFIHMFNSAYDEKCYRNIILNHIALVDKKNEENNEHKDNIIIAKALEILAYYETKKPLIEHERFQSTEEYIKQIIEAENEKRKEFEKDRDNLIDEYQQLQIQFQNNIISNFSKDYWDMQAKSQMLVFELGLKKSFLTRFIYTVLLEHDDIPAIYFLYHILCDTQNRHFDDYIHQSILSGFQRNGEMFLFEDIGERNNQFRADKNYVVKIINDATKSEFSHLIKKAVYFFENDAKTDIIDEVIDEIRARQKNCISFFYQYSLKLIDKKREKKYGFYERKGYDTIYWTRYSGPEQLGPVHKRWVEVVDYMKPNSIGISYDLFFNKTLILPVLYHEYLHYSGIFNEAEVWIKEAHYFNELLKEKGYEEVFKPILKLFKKEILEKCNINALFLILNDLLCSLSNCNDKSDLLKFFSAKLISDLILFRYFNISDLNLIEDDAKELLKFVPLITLLNPVNIQEGNLDFINNYIEQHYGKQMTESEAKEKILHDIERENITIKRMNDNLEWHPDVPYSLFDTNNSLNETKEIRELLLSKYTQKNTLEIEDIQRIRREFIEGY